jgi:hypothetical protein
MTQTIEPWVLEVSATELQPLAIEVGDVIRGSYGYSIRVLEILDPCGFDGSRLLVEEVVAAS